MPKDRKNILGKVGDVFHMDKIGKPGDPGLPNPGPFDISREWNLGKTKDDYVKIIHAYARYGNTSDLDYEHFKPSSIFYPPGNNGNTYNYDIPVGFLVYNNCKITNLTSDPTTTRSYTDLQTMNTLSLGDVDRLVKRTPNGIVSRPTNTSRGSYIFSGSGSYLGSASDLTPIRCFDKRRYSSNLYPDNSGLLVCILIVWMDGVKLKYDTLFMLWESGYSFPKVDQYGTNHYGYTRDGLDNVTLEWVKDYGYKLNTSNYIQAKTPVRFLDPKANELGYGFDAIRIAACVGVGNDSSKQYVKYDISSLICLASTQSSLFDKCYTMITFPMQFGFSLGGSTQGFSWIAPLHVDYDIIEYTTPFISKSWEGPKGTPGPELIY